MKASPRRFTCRVVRSYLDFWALDADPLQHPHVARCVSCREKYLTVLAIAGKVRHAIAASTPEPDPDFSARLEAAVLQVVADRRARPHAPAARELPRPYRWWVPTAIAAALALMAVGLAWRWHEQRVKEAALRDDAIAVRDAVDDLLRRSALELDAPLETLVRANPPSSELDTVAAIARGVRERAEANLRALPRAKGKD
jgi:hypothetical protein